MNTENVQLDRISKLRQSKALETVTKYFLLIAIVLTILFFGVFGSNFLSVDNIMTILLASCVVGLMAMGSMMVMMSGDVNFAVGAQMTLAGAIAGKMLASPSFHNYWLAVAVALACVTLSGVVIAFFVVKLRVPSFIATLGFQTLVDSVFRYLCDNNNLFSNYWDEKFTFLGLTKVFGVVPLPVVITLVIGALMWVLSGRTKIGRIFFSIGRNRIASTQVGIPVDRYRFLAFTLCALLAGIAGILQASISDNVNLATGNGFLLPAISSCILGATFLHPGKYNIPGTLIAAMVNVVVRIGVVSMGGSTFATDIVQGSFLLIAVAIIALVREEGLPAVSI